MRARLCKSLSAKLVVVPYASLRSDIKPRGLQGAECLHREDGGLLRLLLVHRLPALRVTGLDVLVGRSEHLVATVDRDEGVVQDLDEVLSFALRDDKRHRHVLG